LILGVEKVRPYLSSQKKLKSTTQLGPLQVMGPTMPHIAEFCSNYSNLKVILTKINFFF